jgi:LytS/YehU family sensor histidine kinase
MGRFPLAYMLPSKLVLTALGVGASLLLRPFLRALLRNGRGVVAVVVACTVASYVLACLWTAAFNVLQLPIERAILGHDARIRNLSGLLNGSVYHAFTLAAWGFLYLGIKYWLALQDERERAIRAETAAAEARLGALQHQLNPHFLFNTLNAISTLVAERRNDAASEMLARLGDLLRTTLRRDSAPYVALGDELSYVERYLDIERVRFTDRLEIRLDIAEEAYRARVPFLILQPLVENAITHGIAPLTPGGTIALEGRRNGEWLELTITNSAPVAAPSSTNGTGIGIANVRERLRAAYGDRHAMDQGRAGDGQYRVHLRLPFEQAP